MHALIDGDIIRYEVGFAAEAGWKATTGATDWPECIPPWDYVEACFDGRLSQILEGCEADSYTLYITEGATFRDQIATVKPYKGTRPSKKPWHHNNLTAFMTGTLPTVTCLGIEADDQMAMDMTKDIESTFKGSQGMELEDKDAPTLNSIICSRDKDLRQVPGLLFSWELGKQPAFGPKKIDKIGDLSLSDDHKKCTGTGLSFFFAQCLMGDSTDNIPGCKGIGPMTAYDTLKICKTAADLLDQTSMHYRDVYGKDWEARLLEQGRLLWMCRRLNADCSPQMWEIGMTE